MAGDSRSTLLWATLSDALDIPKSLYERAAARHKSVGEWLRRPQSTLRAFNPDVRPQGSFRYGTVVRPLDDTTVYDLDHVVLLTGIDPVRVTQQQLKDMFGRELAAYAAAHAMRPPTEHNRCWRLHYRDDVGFHLDSLPCIPATVDFQQSLRRQGVDADWSSRAVAIADRRRANYRLLDADWLTSNPRGFARWFESRAFLGRDTKQLDRLRAGGVEDVPPYEWRTPLQRSIQILKRHRDVYFRDAADLAPISMIITNLASHAYEGERDLTDALRGIVDRMPNFVRPVAPRIPNPTHPREDYADKWSSNVALEHNFRLWHTQLTADVVQLSQPLVHLEGARIDRLFALQLTANDEERLTLRGPAVHTTSVVSTTPTRIVEGPKPWGS